MSVAPDRRQFLAAGAMLAAGVAVAAPRPLAAARAVIILIDAGGVSQLDSWDPKPSAPVEIRGPFSVTRTRVPGFLVSDLFPRIATLTDKMTVVRTLTSLGEPSHVAGVQVLRETAHRHFGSMAYRRPGVPSAGPSDLTLYGNTLIGRQLFESRQRVENGESVVIVSPAARAVGWDAHTAAGMAAVRDHVAPAYDLAYSALLTDLAERGLLDSTIVVGVSEFGRMPRLNSHGGRHHWTGCWSAIIAGGGFSTGEVIGRSDAWAAEPDDQAISVDELFRRVATPTKFGLFGSI
jgi:uncharacterized protein (DUF1501 family)